MRSLFITGLLLIATGVYAATTPWYQPPGGAATAVSDNDRLPIEQSGVSRTVTRSLLLKGVKPDYRGTYSASVSYGVNSAVFYQGDSYICLTATIAGESPTTHPSKWQLLAQKGATGAVGPAGATGPRGIQGNPGATGATGAKGDKGDRGLTGPAGPPGEVSAARFVRYSSAHIGGGGGGGGSQGPPGTAATIVVGTVTTGAAGSSATVTNAGTSGSAILNFVIPRGSTGTTGSQGPAGPNQVTSSTSTTFSSGTIFASTGTLVRAAISGTDYLAPAGNGSSLTGITASQVGAAAISHNQAWSTITGTPTTLSGYGVTDAYTKTAGDARYPIYHTHNGSVYGVAPGNIYVGTVDPGAIAATDLWIDTSSETGGVSPQAITCTGTDKVSSYNVTTGVFTCTADQTGAGGSGITSLGGLTATTQTFANDTNVTVTSGTSTHTLGWTGTLGVGRGGTGITDFALSGTAHKVASAGFTNPVSAKCVEVDANGNLQIAGTNAVCGSGGSGLSTSLAAAHLYVGNVSGVATDVSVSGDVTLSNTGAMTVVAGTTSTSGKVQLTDSTVSTSTTTAATPNSVKTVNDALALKAPLISPSLTTPTLGVATATRLGITGTAGAGYIDYLAQSSNPSAPAAGTVRAHAVTTNGFTRVEQDNEATTNIVLGRDNVEIGKNTSGITINKGDVVYITGSTGNTPNIAKARADSATTVPALGIALDTILNNAFGQVMTKGIVTGIDTSAFTAGNQVFLSTATAGALVSTRPSGTSGAYVQRIGSVLSSGVSGSMDIAVAPFVGNIETGTTAATFAANALTGTTLNLSGHLTVESVTSTGATGTGKLVFDTSPVFTTPNLGTPSALVLTNATGGVPGNFASGNAMRRDAIEFVIDGSGSVITTGVKGDLEIPYAGTVIRATTLCDQSGSIVIDVWKDTYANYPPTDADSITASAPPTVSSSTKGQITTLTGWTTSFSAGDILRFNVDSAIAVTRCTVSLVVEK